MNLKKNAAGRMVPDIINGLKLNSLYGYWQV